MGRAMAVVGVCSETKSPAAPCAPATTPTLHGHGPGVRPGRCALQPRPGGPAQPQKMKQCSIFIHESFDHSTKTCTPARLLCCPVLGVGHQLLFDVVKVRQVAPRQVERVLDVDQVLAGEGLVCGAGSKEFWWWWYVCVCGRVGGGGSQGRRWTCWEGRGRGPQAVDPAAAKGRRAGAPACHTWDSPVLIHLHGIARQPSRAPCSLVSGSRMHPAVAPCPAPDLPAPAPPPASTPGLARLSAGRACSWASGTAPPQLPSSTRCRWA